MTYSIHNTAMYHRIHLQTLGWELTLCNALEHDASPCRKILVRPESYGMLLYAFLSRLMPLVRQRRILEIGGGYGFLMRDFLTQQPFERILMIDISPRLMEIQMRTLAGRDVEYRCEDFLDTPADCLAGLEIAVLNENIGDFTTITGVEVERLKGPTEQLDVEEQHILRMVTRYGLCLPELGQYGINIGALQALEKLCVARIPYIYLSEHSCEAQVPTELQRYVQVRSPGQPEKIPLMGHDEHTIRFSDFQRVALHYGYIARRGPLAEIIPFELSESLCRILLAKVTVQDEHEVIRQFVTDLYQYEYLFLQRVGNAVVPS